MLDEKISRLESMEYGDWFKQYALIIFLKLILSIATSLKQIAEKK